MVVGEVVEEAEDQVLRWWDVPMLYETVEVGEEEPQEYDEDDPDEVLEHPTTL